MNYKKQCNSYSDRRKSRVGLNLGGGFKLRSTSASPSPSTLITSSLRTERERKLHTPRRKPRLVRTCCNTCNDVVDVPVTQRKVEVENRRSGEKLRLCNNSRSRSRSKSRSSGVLAEEMAILVDASIGVGVGAGIPTSLGDGVCNCQGSWWSRRRVKSKSFCSLFPQDPDYLNRIVLFSLFLLSSFAFLPGFVTGLQCYECLSLQCDSRIICESIKDSITRTFVPNSHYIHFDPRILCPGPDVPTNASEWDAVTFNCSRSDSLCLEAPVEVITSFDGLRDGKKLELPSQMTSLGFLRGCASRRGLNELEVTISVRKIYMENGSWEHFTEHNTNKLSKHNYNQINKFESDYNDGYKITRVHYHEIYVDHGTGNATRCYMDDCNNRKKLRVRSGGGRLGSDFNFGRPASFLGNSFQPIVFNFFMLVFIPLLR